MAAPLSCLSLFFSHPAAQRWMVSLQWWVLRQSLTFLLFGLCCQILYMLGGSITLWFREKPFGLRLLISKLFIILQGTLRQTNYTAPCSLWLSVLFFPLSMFENDSPYTHQPQWCSGPFTWEAVQVQPLQGRLKIRGEEKWQSQEAYELMTAVISPVIRFREYAVLPG